jgi:hypothetical protein
MLPFGVTISTTVPQRSEIPEGLINYHVYIKINAVSNQVSRQAKNLFVVDMYS